MSKPEISRLEESILVLDGELLLSWNEQGRIQNQVLRAGTVVRVGNSMHTFSNTSQQNASFVVFRFIPEGKDKRELIKNDKTVVEF